MSQNSNDEKLHYSGYTMPSPGKKTLAAHANQIAAEESGGVDRRYFSSSYVRDNDHTAGALVRICQKWKIKNKQLTQMKKHLEGCEYKEDGRYKFYKDQDLYDALVSTEEGKKMCDIKKVSSWGDIIVILNS